MGWMEDYKKDNPEDAKVVEEALVKNSFVDETSFDVSKFNFHLTEEEPSGKLVTTIYGNKGEGKTSLAFSFPGTIACLSFDHKSAFIKKYFYNDDKRIKVYNAIEYWDKDPDNILVASFYCYKHIIWMLDEIKKDAPEWICIDGLDIYSQIAEMVMRYKNNLKPYQGFANLTLWKVRKAILTEIHNKALASCKKGVIYTTYSKKEKIVKEGTIETEVDVPVYTDTIMQETDFLIKAESDLDKNGKVFTYKVINSKNDNIIKTGDVIDWTNRGIKLNLK